VARIYRTTDRIAYKIGDLEIKISPLDLHDKSTLHALIAKGQGGDIASLLAGSSHAIKCAVKSVSGLQNEDGTPYQVEFDDSSKYLSDECVADLLNLSESNSMISLCAQLIGGIPNTLPEGITLADDGKKSPNVKAKK
jgi:hypothetical protein